MMKRTIIAASLLMMITAPAQAEEVVSDSARAQCAGLIREAEHGLKLHQDNYKIPAADMAQEYASLAALIGAQVQYDERHPLSNEAAAKVKEAVEKAERRVRVSKGFSLTAGENISLQIAHSQLSSAEDRCLKEFVSQ